MSLTTMDLLSEDFAKMDFQNLTTWLTDLLSRSSGEKLGANSSQALVHNMANLLKQYNSSLKKNLLEESEIYWKEMSEYRRVSYGATCVLLVLYALIIVVGVLGNFLVIWAVIRQPTMRTLRNTFIINLAFSDLLLCLVTTPLTLVEILNKYWPFGNSPVSCKMVGGLQAVSIFVSTMSITAISLDRYQLIVYPTRDLLKKIGAVACLLLIWLLSFLLALPIFLFRHLEHHPLWPSDKPGAIGMDSVNYCYEHWPITHGRALYSVATIVVQYAVPILILSFVHLKICRRLRLRQSMLVNMGKNSRKQAAEKKRLRRLNTLLLIIASTFAVCWFPLNVYNLFLDLYNPFTKAEDEETMLIIYAVFHLLSMSSSCANPFLYGWFNENFRQEFGDIATRSFRVIGSSCPGLVQRMSSLSEPRSRALLHSSVTCGCNQNDPFEEVDNREGEPSRNPDSQSPSTCVTKSTHAIHIPMTMTTQVVGDDEFLNSSSINMGASTMV